ncbi:MAG: putative oxygen-independent coproporphyrinogen III oxidase [Halioglobus sp.]|jgi:putative oxygen-independent coproporphyrinogen III oxidase
MTLPPLSLYIHLPWCERKCPYCDFNSHETTRVPEERYVDSLLADLRADSHYIQQRQVDTLFIGGGTPSLFSVQSIERLMLGLRNTIDLSSELEATMEANPGSAEADKFQGFRQAGINRLSLGVQSFQDEQLQALGRVHSADEAHAAIEMIRASGFDNFNIDLMHGLPAQIPQGALADLKTALAYKPPHVSWYQLTIEPNTVFHNRPPILPVEDALAEIQDCGEELLAASGYSQYEVSAYSQPHRACRHNLNYWSFGDYLGIGAGAHGKISHADGRIIRYSKRRQPDAYMSAIEAQFTASRRELDSDELSGEFMLNALRLNQGFSLQQFSATTGLPAQRVEATIDRLADKKLLLVDGDQVRTSVLGRRFLDSVVAEFF